MKIEITKLIDYYFEYVKTCYTREPELEYSILPEFILRELTTDYHHKQFNGIFYNFCHSYQTDLLSRSFNYYSDLTYPDYLTDEDSKVKYVIEQYILKFIDYEN